jgi:hypothetical protein
MQRCGQWVSLLRGAVAALTLGYAVPQQTLAQPVNQVVSPAQASQQNQINYDLILADPQFPLARLAIDTIAKPPRLLGIGPEGQVYAVNIFIGAPVLEPLRTVQAPPPASVTVVRAEKGAVMAARYHEPVLAGKAVVGWRVLQVRRRSGEILTYRLPDGAQFTERKPLLIDLKQDGLQEVLTVRRDADGSSRMVVFFPSAGKLTPVAETPPVPDNSSLDPIGLADFEGKGQEQIALVSSPESNGYLETYAFQAGVLQRKWRLYGYSSLLAGIGREGVSVLADFNGDGVMDLLLPRNDLLGLGIVTMAGGYSRPLWRTDFLVPLASDFAVLPDNAGGVREVAFLLQDGRLGVLERRVTARWNKRPAPVSPPTTTAYPWEQPTAPQQLPHQPQP